jgi:hypothetical protein
MSRPHPTSSGQRQKRPTAASSCARVPAKLQAYHLDRLAIVYVRQSSPQQVLDHKESTARQYALVDLAVELGWAPDRIEVIDEDQGHTASTDKGRYGFHRLLAEVGLDHVGIILGIELSRLARSNKDWAQLIELCGIFRTLLADHDGLYDPTAYNDRLLLGLRSGATYPTVIPHRRVTSRYLRDFLTAGARIGGQRGHFGRPSQPKKSKQVSAREGFPRHLLPQRPVLKLSALVRPR